MEQMEVRGTMKGMGEEGVGEQKEEGVAEQKEANDIRTRKNNAPDSANIKHIENKQTTIAANNRIVRIHPHAQIKREHFFSLGIAAAQLKRHDNHMYF